MTHSRDIMNILTKVEVHTVGPIFPTSIYGPRASRLGHKSKGNKLGPYLTVRASNSGTKREIFIGSRGR